MGNLPRKTWPDCDQFYRFLVQLRGVGEKQLNKAYGLSTYCQGFLDNILTTRRLPDMIGLLLPEVLSTTAITAGNRAKRIATG
jgi:hypothetical protein